ncbi:autotransporter domain-containing protein [Pontiellaceae bacterium B12227]|nr:autotransporter domain-containing protein [Pontiellaceae bacterium B12227]
MKLTRHATLSSLIILAVVASTPHASANSFDDGTTNNISSDTTYNSEVYVGYFNPDNALIVDSGATLKAGEIILGNTEDSTNNLVSIIGDSRLIAGDATTNGLTTGGIVVGDAGSKAGVSINNSSTMEAEYLYIGYGTNDSGRVEVNNEGSALNIAQDAYVGYNGSDNSLTIGDGAALKVDGILSVGENSSNNAVNVSGTVFVNTTNSIKVADDNSIIVKSGGTLQVGGDVATGDLADLGVDLETGSSLELGGALTLSQNRIDGSHNVILNGGLSADTAEWQSSSVTIIGRDSSNNSLTFTNGAAGTADSILDIGQNEGANNNQLTIGGTGSAFIANSALSIGNKGRNNAVNISDGGQLDGQSVFLGFNSTSTGNEINVNSNGTLNLAKNMVVGKNGAANKLNIDYGQVSVGEELALGFDSANNRYNQVGGTATVTGNFTIGEKEGATGDTGDVNQTDTPPTTGNLAMVGTNATLNIQQNLIVGKEGGGSIMNIYDGGIVNVDGDVAIGEAAGDNYIFLQRDSNTQFNVSGDLIVGKSEEGSNRFAAYGGTADIGGDLLLGTTTNQHTVKNFIHLESSNAVLKVTGSLEIGSANSLNTFDVVDGATATTTDLLVGAYEGTSNNTVTVKGDRSLLEVSGNLEIGSSTSGGNSVILENGGTLDVAQTSIMIGSTNDSLTVADGGILKTLGWDWDLQTGLATNIAFETGSTLHMSGVLSGTNMVEGGLNYVLDGAGASWDLGTSDLYIGNETSNNSLSLTNGVNLAIAGNAFVKNEGTFSIDSTSQAHIEGDYEQDSTSTLAIGVSSNQMTSGNINLVVDGNAEFGKTDDNENNPIIRIFDDGIGESNEVKIVQAGSLTIDGEEATAGNFQANIHSNLLFGFDVTLTNDLYTYIILNNFRELSLGDAMNLEGQLLDVANQIDAMADDGVTNAVAMRTIIDGMSGSAANASLENLYGEKMSSVPANNIINMGIQSVSEQLTMRADNTRDRTDSSTAPEGAAGPHAPEQELQGWISAFGTWGNQDASGGFDGYEANVSGFMVGADLSVADNVLVGLAGGSSSATIDQNAGSSSDIKSIYAALYGSVGTEDWFGDISLIYANSAIDSRLDPTFDTTAEYDAQNFAVMLGGGKEYVGKYLIFTPQASILANYYAQYSYEEKSSDAVARKVYSFNQFYVQSNLGASLAMYTTAGNVTFKPELSAYWQHEWNANEEDLDFRLQGSSNRYTMQLQAPEKDILKLGIGSSAKFGEYLELRADLDTRIGKNYSDYTLLGSLRYQF